ncbi:hypothetical protein DFR70_101408 [Nocardia tenerifensis]|uniref:Uncharacterized protein n=1 Tax=Nocardia tenerifensis TaxID=228006 RepID=A0A318KAU4_9NOCA|nr:hypothetical protein DFR70_101408 [Nocardia tenerifensis]
MKEVTRIIAGACVAGAALAMASTAAQAIPAPCPWEASVAPEPTTSGGYHSDGGYHPDGGYHSDGGYRKNGGYHNDGSPTGATP